FRIPGFKIGPVGYDGFTLGVPDIPRLHTGGIFDPDTGPRLPGLTSNEGLAVLQHGEGVFTTDQMRALGLMASRGNATTVNYSPVINAGPGTDMAALKRLLREDRAELMRELKSAGLASAGADI